MLWFQHLNSGFIELGIYDIYLFDLLARFAQKWIMYVWSEKPNEPAKGTLHFVVLVRQTLVHFKIECERPLSLPS